jgi:hypothetical protein
MELLAVALIFFGETASIAAELIASRRFSSVGGSYLSHVSLWMFLLITVAGIMLVTGYMLGYAHLKNIWIIAALSIGSILVVEPIMAYLLFREMPTTGAAIGLVLGALGTLAALFL